MGMQSLRDKLLQAGLVSEADAKKAEAERARVPQATPRAPSRDAPPREEPRLPKLPPLAGTKEANRLAARKQLELDRKIRERVLATEVLPEPGETTFYFVTRKNKLRRLQLSAAQAKSLEEGRLAVVERPDPDKIEHALVPPEVAAELLALSDKTVRFLNREGAKVGFLTDEEIHARAAEADAPDSPPGPDVPPPDAEKTSLRGASDADTAAPPDATGETWITIKRSK